MTLLKESKGGIDNKILNSKHQKKYYKLLASTYMLSSILLISLEQEFCGMW